jgi:hypothetical protein
MTVVVANSSIWAFVNAATLVVVIMIVIVSFMKLTAASDFR